MRIHLLTENKSRNGRAINLPLLKNKRLLSDMGLDIYFFWNSPYACDITECDALWINSKVFRDWWSTKKSLLLERLGYFQSRVGDVVYLDTTDSSGTVQNEVLLFVSGYRKSFLLKDRSLYLKEFYGGRIYTDFYHREFGVIDKDKLEEGIGAVNDKRHLSKLGLSWNVSLGFDSYVFLGALFFLGSKFTPPQKARPNSITCRIGVNYKRESIRYQRERIRALLNDMHVATVKLPYLRYIRELRNSMIGVSPFGAGEFAYRDFELFMNGCLLFKPDMSHLETWPDLYEKDVTYASFRWDFSDFKDRLNFFLGNKVRVHECALTAQDRFKWYRESREANELFCKKVLSMAGKTIF